MIKAKHDLFSDFKHVLEQPLCCANAMQMLIQVRPNKTAVTLWLMC